MVHLPAYLIFRILLSTVTLFPIGLALFYARMLDRFAPRLRRTALRNLTQAYPEMPAGERTRIADGVFRSLGRMIFAFARMPRINALNVHEWIEYQGLENYAAAKKQGRGILIATAHLGNWELSAFAHAIMTEPMHLVVRPLDNRRIDRFVESRRQLTGNHVIEKGDAPRAILKALRKNEAIGVLIDQNTSLREGVFVDFFGARACATSAFARLAARTGAAVIPGYALWSEDRKRYILHFDPAIPITGDTQADTQRIHAHLETVIRQYPDQWFWIHRRWKTRPPGEPGVAAD